MDDIPQNVLRYIQGFRAERVIEWNNPIEDIFDFMCSIRFSDRVVHVPTELRNYVRDHVIEQKWDLVLGLLKLLEEVPYQLTEEEEISRKEQLKRDILAHDNDRVHLRVYFHIFALYFNLDIFVVEEETPIWRYYQASRDREFKIGDKKYQDRSGAVAGQKQSSTFITLYQGSSGLFYEIVSRGDRVGPPHCPGILEQCASELEEYPASEIPALPKHLKLLQKNAKKMRYKIEYKDDVKHIGTAFWDELIERYDEYAGCKPRRHGKWPECIISMLEKPESHIPRTVFFQILVKMRSMRLLQLLLEGSSVEDITFLKKNEALHKLETNLLEMRNVLDKFKEKLKDFRTTRRRVNNTVMYTSVAGIVGSAVGIVGLVFTPIIFGVPLVGFTIAGGILGGASGVLQGGSRLHEAWKQNGSTSEMKNDWNSIKKNLNESISEAKQMFHINSEINVEHVLPRHGGVGIDAAKAGGSAAAAVASILARPIGLLLDIGFLTEAVYHKHNGDQCNAANILECLIVNESILLTYFRGNHEANKQIVC